MRFLVLALAASTVSLTACSDSGASSGSVSAEESVEERNKRLSREFYENLWFANNTDAYADYVAETYVVHDVGDRKNVTESAIAQKEIADLFHGFGNLTGEMVYQIAEGDMVANRWLISLDPNERAQAMGMTPVDNVPIINVFRFDEAGKIVEIWNHRHDVDLPQPPQRGAPASEG